MVAQVLSLICIVNVLLALSSAWLLSVCHRRRQALTSAIEGEGWNHEVLEALRELLLDLTEPSSSHAGRFVSLGTIIPKIEEVDCEQTLRSLLLQIANDCSLTFDGTIKLANLEQFAKSVYRLQPAYRFGDAEMAEIFSAAVERIKGSVLLSKKVERVELVQSNARVDEKTMWPLNPGLRVKQPFGLVLRTETGEVLSRAKARCL